MKTKTPAGRERSPREEAARADLLEGWPGETSPAPEPAARRRLDPRAAPAPAPGLADVLDAIISRAPGLRAAGVRNVKVGDVQFDLFPFVAEPARGSAEDEAHSDPMNDPHTFAGGRVPMLPRLEEEFDRDDP